MIDLSPSIQPGLAKAGRRASVPLPMWLPAEFSAPRKRFIETLQHVDADRIPLAGPPCVQLHRRGHFAVQPATLPRARGKKVANAYRTLVRGIEEADGACRFAAASSAPGA